MLHVEDWAEIRRLRRSEGMAISEIARVLSISRNTVKTALGSDGPPQYRRQPAGSIVDVVEPRIRELLKAYPTMPATVIAERIGWTRSSSILRARVAQLRPLFVPLDPASRCLTGDTVKRWQRRRFETCGTTAATCSSGCCRVSG